MERLYKKLPGCHVLVLTLFAVILAAAPQSALTQIKPAGSLDYLKLSNGFKQFTLGADVTTLAAKLDFMDDDSRMDEDSCQKFVCKDPELLKIDTTLFLDVVGVRTYKNKIVNVYLFFKKADGYKILSRFLADYGTFTAKPDDYKDVYNWDTRQLSLSLKYELNVDLGIATFTCNNLEKEIKTRREKYQTMQKALLYYASY